MAIPGRKLRDSPAGRNKGVRTKLRVDAPEESVTNSDGKYKIVVTSEGLIVWQTFGGKSPDSRMELKWAFIFVDVCNEDQFAGDGVGGTKLTFEYERSSFSTTCANRQLNLTRNAYVVLCLRPGGGLRTEYGLIVRSGIQQEKRAGAFRLRIENQILFATVH